MLQHCDEDGKEERMTETTAPVANRSIRVGDTAPDFIARSTKGEVRLSSYRGKWLIFFSHPADFTPVCTTEFIGLSVDSLYSHLAWTRAIEQQFGVTIDFPIVEDPSMAVGSAYGMIDHTSTDAMAMRTAYFINPNGVVCALTTYPHNVGRSADEMLRLVSALKTVEDSKGCAPEGWQPGAALLAPPPDGYAALGQGADWFCRTLP